MKMKAVHSVEMSQSDYAVLQCHGPEQQNSQYLIIVWCYNI